MYETQKKFSGNLHALRGLAALAVVLYHSHRMNPAVDVGWLTAVNYFGTGVTLFFILSGFSLSLSNYEKIDRGDWLRGYVIKRAARILPIWYVFIGISMAYHYIKWGVTHTPAEILYNVTVTYPLIPGRHESLVWAGWTIGVEMMFYAIFPLLIVILRNNIKGWLFVTLVFVGVSAAMRPYVDGMIDNSYMALSFPKRGFMFIMGCAFYFITRRAMKNGWANLWAWTMGAVSLLTFTYWTLSIHDVLPLSRDFIQPVKGLAVAALTVFFFVSPTVRGRNWFNLYNPVTKFLGNKSYTIYLAHPIVVNETRQYYPAFQEAFGGVEITFVIYTLMVIAISCAVAAVISTFIEEPIYKKGRAYAEKKHAPAGAA